MRQSFSINIIYRISLIILVTFGISWAIFTKQELYYTLIFSITLTILVINLVYYQRRIINRINYFFESVNNEDFSQVFIPRQNDKIIRDLHKNLGRINLYIQQIKMESQKQEQYLKALIEHVGIGILTFDNKGFVLHANKALKKIFNLEQLTHLRQLDKIDATLATLLIKIRRQEQKVITFNNAQGQNKLLIKASTFKNQNLPLTLLSIQDIKQELDEKELDSWLKLIRVLTHEIMNSIAPVTSLSESLSNFYTKDGKAVKPNEITDKMVQNTIRGLNVIQEQGKGLISFVESYRQLTRLPKPEKNCISVKDMLEKNILLYQAGMQTSKIEIKVLPFEPELSVMADEKLISQVLINLLKNSTEALSEIPEGEIQLSVSKNEREQIEISVKDNGPGISSELINEIFVPFFTTRENGSGIGLSLSRQIMRLHGGSLKARSIPNQETVFTMVFN